MADQAYPTEPIATTTWTAGQTATVAWRLNNPADKSALSIDLFKGDPAHQTLVQNLGTAPAGAVSFKVALPAKLTADWYSVRIGDSYSHYFAIKSAAGATPSGVMPTPVTTSASALPTGNATTIASSASATGTATGTATVTKVTASPTTKPNGASYLSAAPMAMAAAAVVAAAMAF
ncbi:hypothetical protein EDD11_002629 [Mortierella claussenii]|nr:hypothetical protein EDD11_002629 [Mortierella claussenii]